MVESLVCGHPPAYLPPPCTHTIAAGRNFVRAALLGLMATFAGVLVGSAPEYLSQWLKLQLPELLMMPGVQVRGFFHHPCMVCAQAGGLQRAATAAIRAARWHWRDVG